jgi:hypothetical protein
VPDAAFFEMDLANQVGPRYSRAEMKQKGWAVAVDLGQRFSP